MARDPRRQSGITDWWVSPHHQATRSCIGCQLTTATDTTLTNQLGFWRLALRYCRARSSSLGSILRVGGCLGAGFFLRPWAGGQIVGIVVIVIGGVAGLAVGLCLSPAFEAAAAGGRFAAGRGFLGQGPGSASRRKLRKGSGIPGALTGAGRSPGAPVRRRSRGVGRHRCRCRRLGRRAELERFRSTAKTSSFSDTTSGRLARAASSPSLGAVS